MTNYNFRNAAAWLTRNNWQASPAYWAEQAQIRYQLTDQETALLLLNMRLQLTHSHRPARPGAVPRAS